MILDEATANIDTETELLIQDSLEKMAQRVGTMLMVSPTDLSTIRSADKHHGLHPTEQILEQGTQSRSCLQSNGRI